MCHWKITKTFSIDGTSSSLVVSAMPPPSMLKSNVIAVDFRPSVRRADVDELCADLDIIDAALAAAHERARALDAELKTEGGLRPMPAGSRALAP